ncbi:DUF1572 domain-containing protein [Aureispira anguillae]|uniref:DUF1572 domain-containing protein n=1 Tax=Aureispira anguillae TaxID=2864201 RepID=A0A916DVA4_9BACT|nr:DUF1572 domain-containing protein [Aureispira anguillae]BDS14166.1 DUF1572 domain-containing protein [Aureispira anguillae]
MNVTRQIAKHLREVYFGGNWTTSNLMDTLKDLTWEQATTQVYSFNTIATLTYHMNYYVRTVSIVLEGGVLDSKDEYSFNHPPILSQKDWEALQNEGWKNAKKFADLIEKLPEDKLWEDFVDKKYGIYYRNLQGIIEHLHYHLGQIALIKKIIIERA